MKTIKVKKVKVVNEKMLIVSVDIAKKTHWGYMRTLNGKEVKPFSFHNNRQGFEKFWKKICIFKKSHRLEEVVIGFESSGCYAEPLSHYFKEKPVMLVQVNPMHTKRAKEFTGNSPNKTDKKDPKVIADIIFLGHSLTVIIPEGVAAELRSLSHARERAVKDRTVARNRFQDLMFKIFPEFMSIMKDPSTKSALHVMKNYPAPEHIVNLGFESLVKILKKVSRGRLGSKRAKELFEAAQRSVGIDQGKQSILMEIEHFINQIESLNTFIETLERKIKDYLKQIHYSKNILSIKGIGTVTAGGLIGEVGDFNAFDSIKELEKLAGFDLYELSSGEHKGQRRISKRGRALMRKLLYFAAINSIKSKGIMHDKYHQMLNRGKEKPKALIAIARKLLKLIYAVARNNTMYVDKYDHNHKSIIAA